MRKVAHAFVMTGSGFWCLAIVAAPIFHLTPIHQFFSTICHQDIERSWNIGAEPLPVCIRCTSIYFGFFLGVVFRLRPNWKSLQIAFIVTLLEFAIGRLLLDSASLRVVTGLALGATAAPYITAGVSELLEMRSPRGGL